MAAFGAVGEYATTEFERPIVVAFLRTDALTITLIDLGRAFAPAEMGQGDVIEIAAQDRTVIVLPDGRNVTRDDLSGG